MKIAETRVLRGPNVYGPEPMYLAVLAPEGREAAPLAARADAMVRLAAQVPGLEADGTHAGLPELVHALFVALQRAAGLDVAAGGCKPRDGGAWEVWAGFVHEAVAEAALDGAVALARAAWAGQVVDAAELRDDLAHEARRLAVGPSTAAILTAARRADVPILRLTEPGSLYQLGWGVHARRIQATVTGATPHVAAEIAQDKELTKQLLEQAGLPVPRGATVRSEEAAVRAAARLGYPVVVKPLDGNQGKGVSTGLRDEAQVRAAFALAREHRRHVLVERCIPGEDFRVLVVGGRVVAASRRLPAQVVGDGTATVRALVEATNQDPRRGEGHEKPMTKIRLDACAEQVLANQGLDLDAVPAAGQVVRLRENANLSTGGSAIDVTDVLHPRVARACERAARQVGLDVAGIDLVCRDVARPLEDQGGAIIEVNAAPGIRMHVHPAEGQPRDVGQAILDALFPPGAPSRIPVVAVTGTNGKTTTTRLIDHVLRAEGRRTGMTTTEGVYVGGELAEAGDCTGYWSARSVLMDPTVEAAVLETARGGIFKRGLAFDRCDVAVVTNVSDDHLGQHGATSVEDLAAVKGLIVAHAARAAVLNADDPRVLAMRDRLRPGAEAILFSLAGAEALEDHLDAGGRALYLRAGKLVLADGYHHEPLLAVADLPVALGGLARHNVANALAAAGALWALGVARRAIAAALRTFRPDPESAPARLNLVPVNGFQVLIDYAHNAAAYEALIATARALPHRRLIGVLAAAGDRGDDKLRTLGRLAGAAFDVVIARDRSHDLRGRAPGEVAGLILEGVLETPRQDRLAWAVPDALEAIDRALGHARPGDLVVITAADPDVLLDYLLARADAAPDPASPASIAAEPGT